MGRVPAAVIWQLNARDQLKCTPRKRIKSLKEVFLLTCSKIRGWGACGSVAVSNLAKFKKSQIMWFDTRNCQNSLAIRQFGIKVRIP